MATRKYEQRRRATAAKATRRRILDALHVVLTEAPTQPPSVEQIAARAEVSRSTVYLIFGSRSGLFDAFTLDLVDRAGFGELVEAVADPDAREHLRGAVRASTRMFAAERDVMRVLYSMSAIDPDAVGGAVQRQEEHRRGGIAHLAHRLAEQSQLRPGVSESEAADLLWVLASFDAFDQLATGRDLGPDEVADRLLALAERAVCAP